MDSLTFVSSQKQESDSAAERRWENEGGNPGQLQQLPWDDREEDATTDPARGALKAFCYQDLTEDILTKRKSLARGDSAPIVEAAIPVDNPVSKNN
jgi:hypothetical protein